MYLEKLNVPIAITFDDILLEPAESHLEPDEADVRSRFSRNIRLNIPLVSAAMDTVTESAMAIAMAREGGIGVIHRNMSAEREVQEITYVKRAEDLIERNVLTVGPDATVGDVQRLMDEHGISGVPVVDGGKIIGIVSRRDVRAISVKKGSENIRKVMTQNPITVDESITMGNALETMYTNKIERLPVVDGDVKLIGI
ncbi:MAG TPA: IMP dehydrogenase, partial [Methanomicrobiales archaeon]|nr:IMP dehydrogenase [Methanomicrobiales archaeon]